MRMLSTKRIVMTLGLLLTVASASAGDWAHWRGPRGNGDAGPDPLPTQWKSTNTAEHGIVWKTDIPAFGRNTPVIVGDAIYFTSHVDDRELVLVRVDKKSGEVVWKCSLGESPAPRMAQGKSMRTWQKFHEHHNLASPSCTADSEVVVATFGSGAMAVCRPNGDIFWKTDIEDVLGEIVIWWGYANSPLLVDNLVIVVLMHDDLADLAGEKPRASSVVAFEKMTGKIAWKTDRTTKSKDEYNDAYTSPILWQRGGEREFLVFGGETLDAYRPQTGERLWSIRSGLEGNRIVPTPLPCEELAMVFGVRGKRGPIFGAAIRGEGDLGDDAILWQHDKNTPDVASMVYHNGLVFATDDQGMATCLDAKTGATHWRERLPTGRYFSSPLLAGGNVYYTAGSGVTTVVKASATFERVAENTIDHDEDFFASLVVSEGRLFLRGRHKLYCIGADATK